MDDAPAPAPRPVFLAPHYDDVALSCGGTVALLADAGARPLVVTVFGGEPGGRALTAFARWQHERWGTAEADTLATRRAEDRAAAAILGCETRWLPHLDAIYRGERYLSDEALFGPLAPDEAPLVGEIAAEVLSWPELGPGATLYVPLAVCNHVDHQVVYRVGQLAAAGGRRALAYEDFPYAALSDELPRRLAAVRGEVGAAEVVPVGAAQARRIAATEAYRSQLPVIFRFTDDVPGAVGDNARRAGNGQFAERYWPLSPIARAGKAAL